MIRQYQFDYQNEEAIANFTVDTEKFTKKHANATLEFFDWDYDQDEDPIDEVMKKYALKAIKLATFNNYNTFGVINSFKHQEGFALVDGSIGITLTQVEGYEFDEYSMDMIVTSN